MLYWSLQNKCCAKLEVGAVRKGRRQRSRPRASVLRTGHARLDHAHQPMRPSIRRLVSQPR